ncbi:MAG: enoyl-CoA hydratase/isomerase family protein [Dehalococcoidia bacterium]|nr:enoyl-CoA hydratase/isomerase family protein [Dehalococcoidia bacterium]
MEYVRFDRDPARPGLATITLDRPDKLNGLNLQMHDELQRVCRELQDDFRTRVVILTGAGRAFSAGADLRERRPAAPASDLDRRLRVGVGERTSGLIERLDQVTIAAINGLAIGGGLVLTACCDIRLAAASAWFSIPEVDVGLPLTWNALPRLMRELGPARTKELVMTCDRFEAADGLRWGFINHVYPDDELMPAVLALAEKLLAKDEMMLAMTKSATNALAQMMVPEQVTYADRDQMLLGYRLRSGRSAIGGR